MILRKLHRAAGIAVAAFVCLHIANHLVALVGVSSHIAFMMVARLVYRQPAIETLLLISILIQVSSGLLLFALGWKRRSGIVPWIQAASGAYLAFFLALHVSAVFYGRTVLHLDTNFYYAAAGFFVTPYQFFFAPYYFLAVVAVFTHLGCAAYGKLDARPRVVRMLSLVLPSALGAVAALLIVLCLAGVLRPVEMPAKYMATFAHPIHRN